MSNFLFLEAEFPELYQAARRAEDALRSDPRIACFYARFALESAVNWVFEQDPTLPERYENLGDNLHVYEFRSLMPRAVWEKARLIQRIGNRAVHGNLPPSAPEALAIGRELFHFCFWLARTYAQNKPADALTWDDKQVPPSAAQIVKSTRAQVQNLKAQLEAAQAEIAKLPAPDEEELKRLRAELEAAKAAAIQTPDAHNYSEKETRDLFIDTLLREAGWMLEQTRDREFPVTGMPNNSGDGFVDYVLWGDDGLPLGIVEAKKSRKSATVGQQQAHSICRLPRKAIRAAPGDFLHQRLRNMAVGRQALSAARSARLFEKRRIGTNDRTAQRNTVCRLSNSMLRLSNAPTKRAPFAAIWKHWIPNGAKACS